MAKAEGTRSDLEAQAVAIEQITLCFTAKRISYSACRVAFKACSPYADAPRREQLVGRRDRPVDWQAYSIVGPYHQLERVRVSGEDQLTVQHGGTSRTNSVEIVDVSRGDCGTLL
jgi:hypothetical protein